LHFILVQILYAINVITVTDITDITPSIHTIAKICDDHEVSATREPIGVAEKRQQLTLRLSRRLGYIRVSI